MRSRALANPDNIRWNSDLVVVTAAIIWICRHGRSSATIGEIAKLVREQGVSRDRVRSIVDALLTTRHLITCPERTMRLPKFGPNGAMCGFVMKEVKTVAFRTYIDDDMEMQAKALFDRTTKKGDDDGE